jgi:hypothetical protein
MIWCRWTWRASRTVRQWWHCAIFQTTSSGKVPEKRFLQVPTSLPVQACHEGQGHLARRLSSPKKVEGERITQLTSIKKPSLTFSLRYGFHDFFLLKKKCKKFFFFFSDSNYTYQMHSCWIWEILADSGIRLCWSAGTWPLKNVHRSLSWWSGPEFSCLTDVLKYVISLWS